MKSYINCVTIGKYVIHKYIEDGVRKVEKVQIQPLYGFRVKNSETEWKDIYGNSLSTIRFEDVFQAREWKKENKDVIEIYGDISPHIAFITENYNGLITPQKQHMNIYNFDIEVYAEPGKGFPKSDNPINIINAVTFQNMMTNQYYTFSLKDYTSKIPNLSYYKCNSEIDLLESIIDFINRQEIDILTGWNIEGFDIPYIVDRIRMLLGDDKVENLSPLKKVYKSSKIINKHEIAVYSILGIPILDYLELYQKFTFDNKESYTLDFIAKVELGEEKLKFKEEYGNLTNLYNENFELFIDYNIKDVDLICSLDQKLKFIDIAINYGYMMKCNIDDIFGTVKPWDALLYSELYNNKILCSPSKVVSSSDYLGGYVKEPSKGMHEWITVFDIVSSYPNQIISFNLSPETIVPDREILQIEELKQIKMNYTGIEKCIDIEQLDKIKPILEKYNVSFTCNGYFFKRNVQGFIPKIVSEIFNERVRIKGLVSDHKRRKEELKKMLEECREYEYATKEEILKEIEDCERQMEYLQNRSMVLKICINSVYGCLGSNYFRYYDTRISSAVTWQGQLCARGVANYLQKNVDNISWRYSDTDSVFFSLDKVVKDRFKDTCPEKSKIVSFLSKYQDNFMIPVIDKFFDTMGKNLNAREMTIKMEHECLADLTIFVEKKKYVMRQLLKEGELLLDKPKLKIKGIEVVRSSTPQIVRDKLKSALQLILDTNDNDALIRFTNDFRKEFETLPFEKVASPRGVNLKEYNLNSNALPIQVRASLIYNKALKDLKLDEKYVSIGDGSKIKFSYIKMPNIFNSDTISCMDKMPEELSKKFEIDYKTQFEKTFNAPLKKIVETIGWVFEKNNTINEDFFV